jgi:hypothetical protein
MCAFFGTQKKRGYREDKLEETLNEYQRKLIYVLYRLESEVKNGKLLLSRIVEIFNKGLPKKSKLTSVAITKMLKGLGLKTKKSTDNLSVLLWDEIQIKKLFSLQFSPLEPEGILKKGEFFKVQTIVKRELRQKIRFYVYQHDLKMYELYEKVIDSFFEKRKDGNIEYIKPERGGYALNIIMFSDTYDKVQKAAIEDDVSMSVLLHTALLMYFKDLHLNSKGYPLC